MCLIKAFICSVLWELTLNSVCHGPQFVSKMSSVCLGPQFVCKMSSVCHGPQFVCKMSSVCHGPQFVCKMSSHENLFKPNKTITIV